MNSTTAMASIGLAVAGPVADAFGVSIWYLAVGITSTVVMTHGFFVPRYFTLKMHRYGRS